MDIKDVKVKLDTSVVLSKNTANFNDKWKHNSFQDLVARAMVVTAMLSSAGIAGASFASYSENMSSISVRLASFNDNFIVKSSFSQNNVAENENSVVLFDDEDYDEVEDFLSYAHPLGKTREVTMNITSSEKGGISLPDELFEDFDYE